MSEVLVGLAFFDPNVPLEMKIAMVAVLRKTGHPDHPRRIVLTAADIQDKQLCDFVSEHTRTKHCSLLLTSRMNSSYTIPTHGKIMRPTLKV